MRLALRAALAGWACAAWTALPSGGGSTARVLAWAAAVFVLTGALRLAYVPHDQPATTGPLAGPGERAAWMMKRFLAVGPWEELMVVAIVVAEALGPDRPWHTGLLALGLACYLLWVHTGEALVVPNLLRDQGRSLLLGAGLVVVGTAMAMAPGTGTDALARWLDIIAALAAVAAGALALPA